MVDHIRTLLINESGVTGYRKVTDVPSDTAMALFGVSGDCTDAAVVDSVLPLAMSADLAPFRTPFDSRVSPGTDTRSVYRHVYTSCGDCGSCISVSLDGVYDRVLGREGWWAISGLFSSDDPLVSANLTALRSAAMSKDAPFALGAVLIACAYRRLIKQSGDL